MNQPTTLTVEDRGRNIRVVHFHGDLDSVGVRMVEDAFATAVSGRDQRAVIDLSNVTFISTSGLAMILLKGKTLRRSGGSMVIAGASKRIQEVLSMAGFQELFDMYATPGDAVAALENA